MQHTSAFKSDSSFMEGLTSGRLRREFKLLYLRAKGGFDPKRIIQVFPVHSSPTVPEEVLEENTTGIFRNQATGEQFRLQASHQGIALVEA